MALVRDPGRIAGGRGLLAPLSLGLAILAAAPLGRAQARLRQVGLAELTRRAGIIVVGRVVEARFEGHPDYPHVPTVAVTLDVEETLRGPAAGRFTFRQVILSPRSFNRKSYAAGDRLLLFLPMPSQYGLSSPLGHEQGRFHVWRDTEGNDQVANEFSNAGLFRDVAPAAREQGLSLSAAQSRLAAVSSGAVPLTEFVSLVRTLLTLPRLE